MRIFYFVPYISIILKVFTSICKYNVALNITEAKCHSRSGSGWGTPANLPLIPKKNSGTVLECMFPSALVFRVGMGEVTRGLP